MRVNLKQTALLAAITMPLCLYGGEGTQPQSAHHTGMSLHGEQRGRNGGRSSRGMRKTL